MLLVKTKLYYFIFDNLYEIMKEKISKKMEVIPTKFRVKLGNSTKTEPTEKPTIEFIVAEWWVLKSQSIIFRQIIEPTSRPIPMGIRIAKFKLAIQEIYNL